MLQALTDFGFALILLKKWYRYRAYADQGSGAEGHDATTSCGPESTAAPTGR